MIFPGIRRALANRSYRLYAMGNAVSLVGFWLQRVGVGWLTWQLTESGVWLGVMALADAMPSTVLAPITGVIADRFERIRTIRRTQLLQCVQASTLALLALTELLTVEILLALVFALGVIQSFAHPVRLSLIPNLVRIEDLSSAVALNSSLFNLARFVGPAIAGFLITAYGVGASFVGATGCFFFLLFVMFRLEPLRNEVSQDAPPGLVPALVEGFRYTFSQPGVSAVLALTVCATVFCRSFFELLPAFSDRVFDRGPEGLATLVAAIGVGALVSSLWLAGRGEPEGLTRIGVTLLLVTAVGQVVFASTTLFPIAVLCMAIIGFATVATTITCQTLLQNSVHGHMRGRVMSLYGMVMRAGPALGALAFGALSERVGLQPVVLISAAGCALTWLWGESRRRAWAVVLEAQPTLIRR